MLVIAPWRNHGSLPISQISFEDKHASLSLNVRDDPNLPDDSGEAPISKWSGWRFDPRCEIFSLLDEKTS